MDSIDVDASTPAEASIAPAVAAAGFNHSRRDAASDSNLCAALLAITSHDLRQPLQVIRGAHELLTKSVDGVVERVQLARVADATSQLSDKLDQLVAALRLFEPSSGARQEVVPLGPLFTLFGAEFAEAARLKGIRLRIVPTRAAISSNTVLLSGIMRNLIGNAIDYTSGGGTVLVAARQRGRAVHLEVRDSGVGIPAANLTDIFRPFRRVDTTRHDGLGLGLFIVKCAAAFLGHGIQVYSAVGHGSRFVVVADGGTTHDAHHRW